MQNRGALAPPAVDIPPELAAMSYDQILALLNAQQGALQAPGFAEGGDTGGDGDGGEGGEGGGSGDGEGEGGEGEGGEGNAGESGESDEGGGAGASTTSGDITGGEVTGGQATGAAAPGGVADAVGVGGGMGATGNANATSGEPGVGATAGAQAEAVGVGGGLGATGNANATSPSSAFGADLSTDFGALGSLAGFSVSDLTTDPVTGLSGPAALGALNANMTAEIPTELTAINSVYSDLPVAAPVAAPVATVAEPVAERGFAQRAQDFVTGLVTNHPAVQAAQAIARGDLTAAVPALGRTAASVALGGLGLGVRGAAAVVSEIAEALTGEKGTPTPGHEEGSLPGHTGYGDEPAPVDPTAGQGAFTPATTDPATAQNWINTWMQGTPGYAGGGALGYANGGKVPAGSHVIPADVVAAKGNGSSRAGALTYKDLGGRLVNGSGDGRSDSVPARGPQGALRLSRDEVVIPPRGVKQAGGHGALSRDTVQTRQKFQQHLGALSPPHGAREPARRSHAARIGA